MDLSKYTPSIVTRIDDFTADIPTIFLPGNSLHDLFNKAAVCLVNRNSIWNWHILYDAMVMRIIHDQYVLSIGSIKTSGAFVIETTKEQQHALEWAHHRGFYDWRKRQQDNG